ncbi:MAG: hypothetical protein HY319_20915 [Armatimonadetes bacterium]|nr:hypothetical protein [Armatimonadota bacterium]
MLEIAPTPSPATNRILERARDFLEEKPAASDLWELLEEQLGRVRKEKEAVPRRARAQGEDFLRLSEPLLRPLAERFEEYEAALLQLADSLEGENRELVRLACRALADAAGQLHQAQIEYARCYAGYGPSRFPRLNALVRALKAHREARCSREDLNGLLADYLRAYKTALEQALSSEATDDPGLPVFVRGSRVVIEAVEAIGEALGRPDWDAVDRAVDQLGAGFTDIEDARERSWGKLLAEPTPMPAANLLIHWIGEALEGRCPAEDLARHLAAYESHIDIHWKQFETFLNQPIRSARVQEELPRTMEYVDDHDEALARIRTALPELDREALPEAVSALCDAVEKLWRSMGVYLEVARTQGKIVCVRCQRPNPPENRICEACGAVMARPADPEFLGASTFDLRESEGLEDDTQMVMYSNLQRLFDACGAVHAGTLDAAGFSQVLDWADGLLRLMETQLYRLEEQMPDPGEIPVPEREAWERQREFFDEIGDLFLQGLIEWKQGIESMHDYLREPLESHLKAGIEQVWQGATKIHQCKMIGKMAARQEAEKKAGAGSSAAEPEVRRAGAEDTAVLGSTSLPEGDA